MKLKVHFCTLGRPEQNLEADWENFKLVVFNVLQNAIKYNNLYGHIVVLVEFREPIFFNEDKMIIETNIIDTGIGISRDRQKMLFKPFLELKVKQNMQKVNDNNIGLGLSCAMDIIQQLGGDLKINHSSRGFSSFSILMPVTLKRSELRQISSADSKSLKFISKETQPLKRIGLPNDVFQYLAGKEVKTLQSFCFDDLKIKPAPEVLVQQ